MIRKKSISSETIKFPDFLGNAFQNFCFLITLMLIQSENSNRISFISALRTVIMKLSENYKGNRRYLYGEKDV